MRTATAENPRAFAEFLKLAPPGLRPVCASLRALIAALDGSSVEVIWPRLGIASYGVGPRKMTQHYAYIAVQKAHLNLGFYHGASLPDPRGLLEGTGKRLRHVKLRNLPATSERALATLLRRAIAERVPYRNEV